MDGEIVTTGRVARIWEEDGSMAAWLVRQGGRPLHHLEQQLRVRHVHVERTRTGTQNAAESGWGPQAWDVLSPRQSTGMAALLTARYWSCCWGPTWLRRGAHTWGLNTGPAVGGRKWTGATRQVRADPHGQFTGIDVFIACCCLNRHADAIEAANTPESYRYWFWRGGDELKADVQE